MTIAFDIVLALVLIAFAVRGFRSGFFRSVGALAGLAAGGVAAAFLAPLAAGLAPQGTARTIVTISVVALLLLVGYGVGHRIGGGIGRGVQRTPLGPVDRVLGAATQVAVAALVVSALTPLSGALPVPGLRQPVAQSVVVGAIHAVTPAPLEQALAQVRSTALAAGAPSFG